MGIRLKRNPGGGCREWWYASYKEGGKAREMRLPVRVEGTPPASLSLKEQGDARYERSRARAEGELERFLAERVRKGACEAVMERLVASKTGAEPSYARISELAGLWNGIPRERPLCGGRRRENEVVFAEFAGDCGREFAYEVTPEDVSRYFSRIRAEYAWETVKSRMSLLSGAFARFLPCGMRNPFKAVMKRSGPGGGGTVSRVPLTDAQLRLVREKARHDAFLHPLVECAIATGARLKDVCGMKWENVDLAEGFVTYRASKTGALCEIPLFPEFRAVCEGLLATREPGEEYLFPEAARMYGHNPSGLVYRGKKLFATALFGSARNEPAPADVADGEPVPPKTPAEVLDEIDARGFKPRKKERMKAVYRAYAVERKSFRQIERELKVCKTMVKYYLSEIERFGGVGNIVRFNRGAPSADEIIRERTRVKRRVGKAAASIYGWHTFRATFCVLASMHGVPEKAITNAVGHATYRTTMKYYNNPTRAHIREVWMSRMSGTAIGCASAAVAKPDGIGKFVDALSPEQRKAFLLELTNRMLSA